MTEQSLTNKNMKTVGNHVELCTQALFLFLLLPNINRLTVKLSNQGLSFDKHERFFACASLK